ncbi:lipocalin family protein [Aestuariivivens sediminis]|uniref:lipocalin family protein n=1 Tax=Aestuariivivens sediminis TaxID=2913557 RepID=UPI001F576A52|nr:lipocalin family protein [Aestuariivivens sediminis]
MKQIIIVLSAFILLSCNQNHKKEDLLGTWDIVSSIDIETGEVEEFPESDEELLAEFKSDSLYLIENSNPTNVFSWRINRDTLFLNEADTVYIKELTADKLVVEYDFIGMIRLELKKRKQ